MDRASEQGLIVIDGSGPTYATPTVSILCYMFLFFFPKLVETYRQLTEMHLGFLSSGWGGILTYEKYV